MTNHEIADRLRAHAAHLARCGDNLYRVRAFRQAAMAVLGLPAPAAAVGRAGLTAAGVGPSIAATVARYAADGVWEADAGPATCRSRPTAVAG